MCRLLAYLGKSIQLEQLLYKPEHSLIVQSYQPQEMTAGLMNVDGFGVGWYDQRKSANPYIYKNILPIWSDINLPHISRYVESECILGYVRSATPPLAVDLGNCQPFNQENLLFIHNGFIHNFRQTLYRTISHYLDDYSYQLIKGSTDSEHIFALIVHHLRQSPHCSLETALVKTLQTLTELAQSAHIYFSANIILSEGKQLIACRYANRSPIPTLYWLKEDSVENNQVILASEPLFKGNWNSCPEYSILTVGENLEVHIKSISQREHSGKSAPVS